MKKKYAYIGLTENAGKNFYAILKANSFWSAQRENISENNGGGGGVSFKINCNNMGKGKLKRKKVFSMITGKAWGVDTVEKKVKFLIITMSVIICMNKYIP